MHQSSDRAIQELTWFFNEAEIAIGQPSLHAALVACAPPSSVDEAEARVEALHAARKIARRLATLPVADVRVLDAYCTERPWPAALEGVLHGLVGVVEAMPAVRAEHLTARARGQTRTPDVTRWLRQLVAERSPLLKAWREQAEEARSRALAAYERARGTGPSLVPEDR
jgi:hypothetical protein